MRESYGSSLIVNNELLNKNILSASIHSARKNVINGMLAGNDPMEYYGVPYLSPDYIIVRSALVANGFIQRDDIVPNRLQDGRMPQVQLREVLDTYIARAGEESICFGELYEYLKQPPFGLRNGYLPVLFAYLLIPYKKALIISSHNVEQELSVDLFEEVEKRPNDYSFIIETWSREQLDYMDSLEQIFEEYIKDNLRSKNRLKAIYDGMLSHYRNISKFARTTKKYASDEVKRYRKLMERNTSNYSTFLFEKLKADYETYDETIAAVKRIKETLDGVLVSLSTELCHEVCSLFGMTQSVSLGELISKRYKSDWEAKRNKSFDYYTNAFLDFSSKVSHEEADFDLIMKLSKALTGFELLYWNDTHRDEFMNRLTEIKTKLDAYVSSDKLGEKETRMTLSTANGNVKTVVFDQSGLNTISQTVKNKINATFNNFGLSIGYDEKMQILLSLLEELMEGK